MCVYSGRNQVHLTFIYACLLWWLKEYVKAAVLQMLKNKKNKQILKLTVKTGQVMFSEEIYYYWHLNSVDKSLVKHRLFA